MRTWTGTELNEKMFRSVVNTLVDETRAKSGMDYQVFGDF